VGDLEPEQEEDPYQDMDGRFGDDPNGHDADQGGREARDQGTTEAVLADAHSSGTDQADADPTDADPTDADQTRAGQSDADQRDVDQAGTQQADADREDSDSDAARAGVGFGSEPGLERRATERKEGPL
jgi:hypothetical protein